MKRIVFTLLILMWPAFALATSGTTEITLTEQEALQVADNLIEIGRYSDAQKILTQMPLTGQTPLEIERWYLLAKIERLKGNFDEAIRIYRKLLDEKPDLVKIRYELALCHMKKEQWHSADYHLRLAMTGEDLPDDVRKRMAYYRYVIRQNKRWNIWFNLGAAPDRNINNGNGGQECIVNGWGRFCRDLKEPESVVGMNITLGGDYEFVLSEQWRWKSEANIYSNTYDKSEYDDLYLIASTGPRYIWNNGDVWLAAIGVRRWYGGDKYNYSFGGKVQTNYDFTRSLSGGLTLQILKNKYDDYGPYLNGQTYFGNLRLTYAFNAHLYTVFRTGLTRENAKNPIYSYWQPSVGIGFGAELPKGFHIYVEPFFYRTAYDDKQWVVKDNQFTQIRERDFVQRYSVSVSNNKFDVWGFVPTVTLSFTKRNSNVWQREYKKTTLEFTFQQRF